MTEFYEPDKGGRSSGWRGEVDRQRRKLEEYIQKEGLSDEDAKYYRDLFDAPIPHDETDGIKGQSDHGSHGSTRGGGKDTIKGRD